MSTETMAAIEKLLQQLHSIDGVTSKKMFGGHGIFFNNNMFGLIDSRGLAHLKADTETSKEFVELGGQQHSRMPYWSIPKTVLENEGLLREWTERSFSLVKKK